MITFISQQRRKRRKIKEEKWTMWSNAMPNIIYICILSTAPNKANLLLFVQISISCHVANTQAAFQRSQNIFYSTKSGIFKNTESNVWKWKHSMHVGMRENTAGGSGGRSEEKMDCFYSGRLMTAIHRQRQKTTSRKLAVAALGLKPMRRDETSKWTGRRRTNQGDLLGRTKPK